MILADKIIEERKRIGLSQEELAEKLNVSRQSVSKWEGAQSIPDINRIIMLAEILIENREYKEAEKYYQEIVKKEENIVDLKEEAVPNVKNVTIEDASEYYNDLGLEYNVNYKDNRVSSVDEFSDDEEIKVRKEEKAKTTKRLQEESDKNKKNQDPTDEEDLFNLIESMYEKDN